MAMQIAQGHDRKVVNDFVNDPLLVEMFQEYELCRTLSWSYQQIDVEGNKRKIVSTHWPEGISQWPNGLPLSEQSLYYVRIFTAFLFGEREGFITAFSQSL